MATTLKLYSRYGCHLCDDMLEQLNGQREKHRFLLEVIDITGDERLEALYGTRVPVLAATDAEICYYFLDEAALDKYFRDL
ncbi:MAG: glutaredoxin family protein [Gammaproteobacteria bacterium]|nr:glutaredoxin family protein [Gammaproteobacteria bacterium]